MGCSLCGTYVTEGVYKFSLDKYNRVLCEACQEDVEYEIGQGKLKTKKVSRYSTPEAIELYNILIKNGFNAQLEKWDGFKHIDIAIPDLQVNIEVDGKQHIGEKQALADLKRTFHSFKKGYVTLRIPNSLVQNNIYETAKYIMHFLKASERQLDEEDYDY
jgi:very-short-patch-repair endonuclease